MSHQEIFKEIVSKILRLLSEKNYCELEKQSNGIRLSASDLEQVIIEYNHKIVEPPPIAYEDMDVIEVKGGNKWSVVMPLWSQDEGRSDLSIELTIVKCGNTFKFEIDDLHVL